MIETTFESDRAYFARMARDFQTDASYFAWQSRCRREAGLLLRSASSQRMAEFFSARARINLFAAMESPR